MLCVCTASSNAALLIFTSTSNLQVPRAHAQALTPPVIAALLRLPRPHLPPSPAVHRPWQLLQDGYTFDLQQRPPTPTFDLLTSYLEIKYADILLQKDAVQTLNRQMALQTLKSSGGLASELLEQPPAALTAAKTLSPEERESLCKPLDDLLGYKQFGRYREVVLQLYSDGLISWDDLQECWAAAQSGEELNAAAEGPVALAGELGKGLLTGSRSGLHNTL